MSQKHQLISGFTLKWIAVVSMVIDHFGFVIMNGVLEPYKTDGYIHFTADMPFFFRNAMVIKSVCGALGSMAFPIFCFLVVEGVMHTRNIVRYGICMAIFALVSEIPYNLAHGAFFYPKLQNVMVTFCISIFTLFLIKKIEEHYEKLHAKRIGLTALTVVAGMLLAFLIRGEYVFLGVLAISLLYLLREKGYWRLLGFVPLLIVSPWILLALMPVLLYNGQRGKGSKYFFYIFYPTHFLVFTAIATWFAGR